MKFLRWRGGTVEKVWTNDNFTSIQKASALYILTGSVIIARHPYDRLPPTWSGAGNCWCGRDQSSPIHNIVIDEG